MAARHLKLSCFSAAAAAAVQVTDLHRHFIDDITIPSSQGKGLLRRVDDVFDCWFESGSMPYGQVGAVLLCVFVGGWVGGWFPFFGRFHLLLTAAAGLSSAVCPMDRWVA
jgi:hypothetical protein